MSGRFSNYLLAPRLFSGLLALVIAASAHAELQNLVVGSDIRARGLHDWAVRAPEPVAVSDLLIVIHGDYREEVQHIADLFAARVRERSAVDIKTGESATGEGEFVLAFGIYGDGSTADTRARQHGISPPAPDGIAPEAFVLKTAENNGRTSVIVLGADRRGLLYGVGELLRRINYGADEITIPHIDLASAPAYKFRGSSANQGGTMRQVTGARAWTPEEWQHYVMNLAFSGANIFYADGANYDFVKSFDLMTVTGCRPNQLEKHPPEWQATERGPWVCPSIPEARAALLENFDKDFAQRKDHDVMRMYAGDPGGCRCEKCEPWGKTFVELCEEVAAIWLKYHPNSIVQIANQDLSNEGDTAIFEYLRAEPREWLQGIAYGPGSNAMSDYFRNELRDDLFVYPAHGPLNRYLAETLHQLPPQQTITHYSDITHWISAQFEVEHAEPNIFKIYGRRTFHARPQAFYDIFQKIMPFSEGDIIYSEGYHDEFHQYMWNRLLWNPNQSLDDVMLEYGRYYFGLGASYPMMQAMLELENDLETPLANNESIARYYDYVKQAGEMIPPNLMNNDHRWRAHMEKAALDMYFQKKLQNELARTTEVEQALATGDGNGAIQQALELLGQPLESPEMAAWREEAGRLGEESEKLFGIRNVGYFSTDKPLTDLAWYERELKGLQELPDDEQQTAIKRLVRYEDPGPGGYYDDAGNSEKQPHLIKGESYNAAAMMDPSNRTSQNTIAYNLEEPVGVVFRYTDLDPNAQYTARATLVMPRIPRQMLEVPVTPRRVQNVLADGEVIAENVEIPEYTAEQFEFEVPRETTADGILELAFARGEGAMGVVVSEVWLRRE